MYMYLYKCGSLAGQRLTHTKSYQKYFLYENDSSILLHHFFNSQGIEQNEQKWKKLCNTLLYSSDVIAIMHVLKDIE